MKKLLFFLFICISFTCVATDISEGNFKKVFYKDLTVESGPVTITIVDGVATEAYIKFKMRVKNNTSDYILLNTDNIIMKVNGTEYKNMERDLLVGPNDEDYKVIDIKGSGLQVEKFTLELKGFSRVAATSGAVKANNFVLPIEKNEFTAGPFKLVQLKSTKKTDNVVVKFSVEYNGDQIGIVHPGQVSLLTPKGTEFANMASRGQRNPEVLKKGQGTSFIVQWKDIQVSNGDMQFAKVELLWHDCFRNTTSEPFSVSDIEVVMDKELTEGKNK
jgi:hypothetical protein